MYLYTCKIKFLQFFIVTFLYICFSTLNIFNHNINIQVIDAIADAISGTEGCSLLDVDPGSSTNRTVYTFVGSPEAVIEGALNAARVAFKLIDMSKHSGMMSTLQPLVFKSKLYTKIELNQFFYTGEHPRMGALDVCPFIPVQNVTMMECVECANAFGQRLSDILNVPGVLLDR